MDPRIVHGNLPADTTLVDEPNMLVQSLTRAATREEKSFKSASTRAVEGIEYTNPMLTFNFDAIVSTRAGLCDQHPGTTVAGLLNFTTTYREFDPTEGTLIFKDPSDESGVENPDTTKFSVVLYPFLDN